MVLKCAAPCRHSVKKENVRVLDLALLVPIVMQMGRHESASGAASLSPTSDLGSLVELTRERLRALETAATRVGVSPCNGHAGCANGHAPLAAHTCDDWELNVQEAFERIDTNGDGVLSRAELIRACRVDERVRQLLGLPRAIRQEDGTRDAFEAVFQGLDADGSKTISLDEFVHFFGHSALCATMPNGSSSCHCSSSSHRGSHNGRVGMAEGGPALSSFRSRSTLAADEPAPSAALTPGSLRVSAPSPSAHALSPPPTSPTRALLARTATPLTLAPDGVVDGAIDGAGASAAAQPLRGLSHRLTHLAGGWWSGSVPDTLKSWWNRQSLIEQTSELGVLPLTEDIPAVL